MKALDPMNFRSECRAGFSLVEIMIVVSLIGMLAAIALPNFIRSRTRAHTSACINNLREIDYAIQQWAMEERKASQTVVQFTDISSYLKHSVVCPAGGTSFADSYSITIVGAEPICLRLSADHLITQTGLEAADTSGSTSAPPSSTPSGNGNGNANGNGNGNGHGNGNGNNGNGGNHGHKP